MLALRARVQLMQHRIDAERNTRSTSVILDAVERLGKPQFFAGVRLAVCVFARRAMRCASASVVIMRHVPNTLRLWRGNATGRDSRERPATVCPPAGVPRDRGRNAALNTERRDGEQDARFAGWRGFYLGHGASRVHPAGGFYLSGGQIDCHPNNLIPQGSAGPEGRDQRERLAGGAVKGRSCPALHNHTDQPRPNPAGFFHSPGPVNSNAANLKR